MKRNTQWLLAIPGACLLLFTPATQGELIINGGFEEIALDNSWDIFSEIPGWTLVSGPSIEIQRGVGGWSAYDGEQWVELDSDENGPGNGHFLGEGGSSSIEQNIETTPGGEYLLTFAFSARPGVDDNQLLVEFDDGVVFEASASGAGLDNTAWELYELIVTASSDITTLRFSDMSVSNTLGTLIDGVSLTALPGPAVLGVLLPCLLASRRRR